MTDCAWASIILQKFWFFSSSNLSWDNRNEKHLSIALEICPGIVGMLQVFMEILSSRPLSVIRRKEWHLESVSTNIISAKSTYICWDFFPRFIADSFAKAINDVIDYGIINYYNIVLFSQIKYSLLYYSLVAGWMGIIDAAHV